jgi:hypothetical protein
VVLEAVAVMEYLLAVGQLHLQMVQRVLLDKDMAVVMVENQIIMAVEVAVVVLLLVGTHLLQRVVMEDQAQYQP